jgi:hypothetical protein
MEIFPSHKKSERLSRRESHRPKTFRGPPMRILLTLGISPLSTGNRNSGMADTGKKILVDTKHQKFGNLGFLFFYFFEKMERVVQE